MSLCGSKLWQELRRSTFSLEAHVREGQSRRPQAGCCVLETQKAVASLIPVNFAIEILGRGKAVFFGSVL
jgi:hypothetical protein